MSRPWCFSWCCPACDCEHSWSWEVWDMPPAGSEILMHCEISEGGCGRQSWMVLAPGDESRMVPA